jgi:hypothetical protein
VCASSSTSPSGVRSVTFGALGSRAKLRLTMAAAVGGNSGLSVGAPLSEDPELDQAKTPVIHPRLSDCGMGPARPLFNRCHQLREPRVAPAGRRLVRRHSADCSSRRPVSPSRAARSALRRPCASDFPPRPSWRSACRCISAQRLDAAVGSRAGEHR